MAAVPNNMLDLCNELGMDPTNILKGPVVPGNNTAAGGSLWSGSGVPSAGLGANGDFYLRTDTPATLAQRIYIKSAGSWINALA